MRLKIGLLQIAALALVVAGCGGKTERSSGGGGTGGTSSGGAGADSGPTDSGGTAPTVACNLSLIASGALPQKGQRQVDSLAIAASADSFSIAYFEKNPMDGVSQDTALVNLPDNGQLGSVVRNEMPGCVGPAVSRGSAVTFDTTGSAGLAAFAVTNCSGSGAGAMFFALSADGSPKSPKTASANAFSRMEFGSHALAPIGVDRFAFAYRVATNAAPNAQLATLTGDQFDGDVSVLFGALDAHDVAISTSVSVRGLIGHLTSGMELLQIGASDTDAGADIQKQLGIQPWGAVAAIGSRVAVMLPSAIGLQYQLFVGSSKSAFAMGTFKGAIYSLGDLAALGDRLIAVGANGKSLALYRLNNATGTPATIVTSVQKFSGKIGTEPLPDIEQVAIAAARSTVAVVFAGKGSPGGWALFSCKG